MLAAERKYANASLIAGVLLLVLFFLSVNPPVPTYLHFEPLTDASVEKCSALGSPSLCQIDKSQQRVDYFAPLSTIEVFRRFVGSPVPQTLVILLLALLLALNMRFIAIRTSHKGRLKPAHLFFIFFALSFLIHFRLAPYFYWDEWHVFERFLEKGFSGIIAAHNEHFIPLFFGLYAFERWLFGDSYQLFLIVSLIIHAFNATLLALFLRRLVSGSKSGNSVTRKFLSPFVATLYLVASPHVEVLQSAIGQCALLAQTATFLALLFGWEFITRGRLFRLVITIACLFLAPFFFGNGFVAFLHLGLVVILGAVFSRNPGKKQLGKRLKRMATLFFWMTLSGLAAGAIFYWNQKQGGYGISTGEFLENTEALWEYLLVGSQLGTVPRSLGFFPALDLGETFRFFSDFLPEHKKPLLTAAWWSFGLSALIGVGGIYRSKERRRALRLWLLGQTMLFSTFSILSLGRWQFGALQALSLRYQACALVGMAILCIPFLETLFRTELGESRVGVRISRLFQVFLVLFFAGHFFLAVGFPFYAEHGAENRVYIAQLVEWKEKGVNKGPEWKKFEPQRPQHLVPHRGGEQVYKVLRYLHGN